MRILALDLGTTTGWAMDGVSGFVSFKNGRYEGGGMRYLRFLRWLQDMLDMGVDAVVFEEVRRHQGTDAAHVYGGLLGQLTALCEEVGVPYQGVPVGTIKRFATGKGNANKAAMIAAAREQGEQITDDNQADAYWLHRYAVSELFGG